MRPFVLDFNLISGLCESGKARPTNRRVSDMAAQFYDTAAADAISNGENPLLYSFYELTDIPERSGDLRYGTTIVYPGEVGGEYFMTKGHFHTMLDTAEVYYCLSGEGGMLMETPEGQIEYAPLKPGDSVYVPGRWAHRSINTGDAPLVMFFCFPADAGHDYGTIEQKGFRKLVVNQDGRPTIIDNPRWK